MKTILKKHFVSTKNDIPYYIVEIACDTADDLPETDEFDGIKLFHGSVAWVISTGDFYGLSSDGEWVCQTGGDTANEEAM